MGIFLWRRSSSKEHAAGGDGGGSAGGIRDGFKSFRDNNRHSAPGNDSVCSDSSRDIPYSEDWQDVLRCAATDLGGLEDSPGCLLLTDALGVELDVADKEMPQVASERFPLRLRYVPCGHAPRRISTRTPPQGNQDGTEHRKGTQISLLIDFADVWPGIVKVKLDHQSLLRPDQGLESVVATDSMGVELDLQKTRGRVPSPEKFPLKLHFRSNHIGPQNVRPTAKLFFLPEKRGDRYGNERSGDNVQTSMEHSMEVHLPGILSDIVDAKLLEAGVRLDEDTRSLVLITDCLGVVVKPLSEGIPSRDRFPIKAHIESSVMHHIEQQDALNGRGPVRRGGNCQDRRKTNGTARRFSNAYESVLQSFFGSPR